MASLLRKITGVGIVAVLIVLAFLMGRYTAPRPQETPATATTETTATVEYTPKQTAQDADIELTTPPQVVTVSVNGRKQTIEKATDERYTFDKNKLTYTQKSTTDLNITVPDSTRHWSIGVGVGRNGAAGLLRFPLRGHVGGWIAGDRRSVMGGVSVNF